MNLIKRMVKDNIIKYWDQIWNSHTTCRQTKLFIPHINKSQAVDFTRGRRNYFSAIVQFITGHNFMNRQEAIAKFGHANFDAAKCRFCQKGEESTFHVLTECDAFAATRQCLWGETEVHPPY